MRTSVEFVDFAAADAHKWLLGPLGTAILYVRKEHYDRFHPPLVGWNSASSPNFIAQESLVFKPDARRYEPGSLNLAGIIGLRAALQLILECGMEAVEARVLALARQIIAQATRAGFTVIGPTEGAGLSGIVSLSCRSYGHGEVACQAERGQCYHLTALHSRRQEMSALVAAFLQL